MLSLRHKHTKVLEQVLIVFLQDNGAYATAALFKLLSKKDKPVILLGPQSTKALEPVAEAAPLWRLVQV